MVLMSHKRLSIDWNCEFPNNLQIDEQSLVKLIEGPWFWFFLSTFFKAFEMLNNILGVTVIKPDVFHFYILDTVD